PGDHLRNAGSADTQRAVVHSVGVARLSGFMGVQPHELATDPQPQSRLVAGQASRHRAGCTSHHLVWGTVLLIVCGSPKPSPAWTACWAIRVTVPERGTARCALGGDAPAAAPVGGLLAQL